MQASSYFLLVAGIAIASAALACTPAQPAQRQQAPQAVRAVEVRHGDLVTGRSHLAEVVPERLVSVIAQVSGTVTAIDVAEGAPAMHGTALVRISTPDVAARVARIRSERKRAERERDFACKQLQTDRVLAGSGDLTAIELDRSERGCSSAGLAVEGAQAGEREASVSKAKGVERAPFDGVVLSHLVDEGQTVMPGTPLLQLASRESLLLLRVPESDLVGIRLGGRIKSEVGDGSIISVSAQAQGPGRLVELLIKIDEELSLRVGATLRVTLIVAHAESVSAVPEGAIGGTDGSHYLMVIEDDRLQKLEVALGVRDHGWVEVQPALPKGTRVALGASTLDASRPLLVVTP